MNDFIELVKEGFRLIGNLGGLALDFGKLALDELTAQILAYFNGVKKWTIRILLAAAFPLIVIVPCMLTGKPFSGLFSAYVIWFTLLFAAELMLIAPMFVIWRLLEKHVLPEFLKTVLKDYGRFIKAVLFNGLSFALFVAVFPKSNSPGASLLLIIVFACWLTLPACHISAFFRLISPYVQIGQVVLLAGVLWLQLQFPHQMERFKWVLLGTIAEKIDLAKQREVTGEWKTLTWFNNNGDPLIWHSGSVSNGFRLWAAPGSDPQTREELLPVNDETTRRTIVASLAEYERFHTQQKALEPPLPVAITHPPKRLIEDLPTQWFDLTNGAPLVWFSGDATNGFKLYDGAGYDEESRAKLQPADPARVAEIKAWWLLAHALTESPIPATPAGISHPPKRFIEEMPVQWFDPTNGRPLVWFSGGATNGFKIYSGDGYDEESSVKLQPVDPERVTEIKAWWRAARTPPAILGELQSRSQSTVVRMEDKYIADPSLTNNLDTMSVALIVVNDSLVPVSDLISTVAALARTNGWAVYANPFNAQFLQDGVFQALVQGRGGSFATQMHFENRFDRLWLGEMHKTIKVQEDSHGLTTMTESIRLCELSSVNGAALREFTVKADSTAMSESTAEEKLSSRIRTDLGKQISGWGVLPMEKKQ